MKKYFIFEKKHIFRIIVFLSLIILSTACVVLVNNIKKPTNNNFLPLTKERPVNKGYFRNNNQIIYSHKSYYSYKGNGIYEKVVEDADIKTFKIISDAYAIDKNTVFLYGYPIKNSDPDTFQLINSGDGFYSRFAKDKNQGYGNYARPTQEKPSIDIIEGIDYETFKFKKETPFCGDDPSMHCTTAKEWEELTRCPNLEHIFDDKNNIYCDDYWDDAKITKIPKKTSINLFSSTKSITYTLFIVFFIAIIVSFISFKALKLSRKKAILIFVSISLLLLFILFFISPFIIKKNVLTEKQFQFYNGQKIKKANIWKDHFSKWLDLKKDEPVIEWQKDMY